MRFSSDLLGHDPRVQSCSGLDFKGQVNLREHGSRVDGGLFDQGHHFDSAGVGERRHPHLHGQVHGDAGGHADPCGRGQLE